LEFNLLNIYGKKVTIFGAGRSGVAVAELLAAQGAKVLVYDDAPIETKSDVRAKLNNLGIRSIFNEPYSVEIFCSDWWVISPGVPISHPLIKDAHERKIEILGELEAAYRFCLSPIIAVTGSNGKSTTTALLGEIFEKASMPHIVAGNIGTPFSGEVTKTKKNGVTVLEVSSFQLEAIKKFRPKVAIWLNLTRDHMDRHGTIVNYRKIKARIFENQTPSDYLIFNGTDEHIYELAQQAKSEKLVFGLEKKSMGCSFVRDGELIVRITDEEERIFPIQKMGIRGEHNVKNALAAILAAREMGVDLDPIRKALISFKGLPHRLEFVRELSGVQWINDSKATNVDSVWFALGTFNEPIILIVGGRDKDSDFEMLRDRLRERVKGIVLLGEAAEKMRRAFRGIEPLVRAFSLEEAVKKAQEMTKPGDVVLLSPACASFDMFRDFEDRGEQFKTLVRQL